MGEYSSDKALLHADRIAALQAGEQPYPVYVHLVLSDFCNQSCRFCAYRSPGYSSNQLFHVLEADGVNNNPRRMIPWPKLRELVDDFCTMDVRAVLLTGGGEPTLHPQFDQVCELLTSRGVPFALNTNGVLLKPSRDELLSRAAWLRVSVDAGTAETYASLRGVPAAEFGIVAKNVARFAAAPSRGTLGCGFVVTRDNYRELFAACQNFKAWGADNVRIAAMHQNEGAAYFADFRDEVIEQIEQAKTLADDRFKVFDTFVARHSDLAGSPDYSFCGHMNLVTYIGGDQNVYSCCVLAYNERGLIGSIHDQSFKTLWDSQAKRDKFSNFDARGCTWCMFNEKNRTINAVLRPRSVHDNFV